MKLGRRILTGAAGVLVGVTGVVMTPWVEPAAAAGPTRILNNSGTNWVESQAGVDGGGGRQVTVTFLVEHVAGRSITGLAIDNNWDGTDNTASVGVTGVSAQAVPGTETSRVTFSFDPGTPGGFSCPIIGSSTRRRDVPLRFRVVDNTGERSASVTQNLHVVEDSNGTGCQDFPRMTGFSQSASTAVPGANVNFTFSCDDVDTDFLSSDDDCDRANIRWRRLDDGATGGGFEMTGIDDNSNRSFDMSFPAVAGRYVVEAQLGNENGSYPDTAGWWRIGGVDVNSAVGSITSTLAFSAPSGGLFASTPPSVNVGTTVNAVMTASDSDGAIQLIDWDATNDGGFERREYTVPTGGGAISHPSLTTTELTQSINTSTFGNKSVRAQVTDNGALDIADTIRRTAAAVSADLRVNAIPAASAQTVNISEDSGANTITLSSTDADNQPLAAANRVYTITASPPASAGTLNCTTIPSCTFTPADDFNGSTSFKFKVADGPVASGANAGQAWAESGEATVTINVAAVNDAPVADGQTVTTDEDTPITFSVSASDIDGGQTLTFSAQTQPANGSVSCTGTDGSVPYTGSCTFSPNLNFNGSDSFILRATDNGSPSLFGTATINLTVNPVNDAPEAVDQSFNIDEDAGAQSFTLSASDVDLDSLSFSIIAPPVVGGSVSCAGAACTFTPDDDFNGTSVITFQVNDDGSPSLSDTGTVTFNVAPVNDPPQAVAQDVTTDEDTAVDITLGATDIDTPPAGLDFTAPTGTNGPDHGTVTEVADPVFNYDPDANYFGGDQFDFTVSDGEFESSNTVVLTINPVNDAPTVPSPQAFTTDEDTAAILSIEASDIDGDELTFEVTSGPSNGELIGSLPDIGYKPELNFNGSDSFTFVVRDGNGGETTGVADITINPVNDRPVATAVTTSTPEDTPTTFALVGDDVDGDTLTFTVLTPSPSALGDLSCDSAGACTYTPASNANGADTFVFEVNDGNAFDTADVTITIEPVNDPPTVAAVTEVSTDEDTPLVITLHATDDDGDALEYSAGAAASGMLSGEAPDLLYTPAPDFFGTDGFTYLVGDGTAVVSGFVHITVRPVNDAPVPNPVSVTTDEDTPVTFQMTSTDVDSSGHFYNGGTPPVGSQLCGADTCTYTPPTDFVGIVQWSFTVTDGEGASASALITIGVQSENDAPVATRPTSVTTSEDTAVSVTLEATDVDGDDLSFSITDAPDHGSFAGTAPALTYTPASDYNGSDSFTFQVDDGRGGSDTRTVPITITPVNDAPLALPAVVSADEDTAKTFNLQATDVEGDALTFAVVSGVSHGTLVCTPAGACTYTPAADYNGLDSFTFSVTDPSGGSSTATVSITVAAAPLFPTRLVAEPVLLTLGPVFRATLTRADTGAPVAGRLITFTAGGQLRCQAVTNAVGFAQCGAALLDLVALVNLGYDAGFAGDFDYASTTARGVLLRVTLKLF